jgi:hypothetical protein
MYFAICVTLILSIMSCSVVGLGVGALIDTKTSRQKQVGVWEMGKINRGAEITVVRNDSSTLSGKFSGLLPVSDSEYQESYARLLKVEPDSINLPLLGESIEIMYEGNYRKQNIFGGFDYQFRYLLKAEAMDHPYNFQYLIGDKMFSDPKRRIYISDINSLVRSDQTKLTGNNLRMLSSNGQLPLRSQVVMLTRNGLEKIPLTSIKSANVQRARNAKWIGFGLGLSLDILIFYTTYLLYKNFSISF